MASADERTKSSPDERIDKAGAEFKKLRAEIEELKIKIAVLEIQIPIRKIKYYKREPPKEGEPIPEEVRAEFDRIKKLHEPKQKRWNDFGTEKT